MKIKSIINNHNEIGIAKFLGIPIPIYDSYNLLILRQMSVYDSHIHVFFVTGWAGWYCPGLECTLHQAIKQQKCPQWSTQCDVCITWALQDKRLSLPCWRGTCWSMQKWVHFSTDQTMWSRCLWPLQHPYGRVPSDLTHRRLPGFELVYASKRGNHCITLKCADCKQEHFSAPLQAHLEWHADVNKLCFFSFKSISLCSLEGTMKKCIVHLSFMNCQFIQLLLTIL